MKVHNQAEAIDIHPAFIGEQVGVQDNDKDLHDVQKNVQKELTERQRNIIDLIESDGTMTIDEMSKFAYDGDRFEVILPSLS